MIVFIGILLTIVYVLIGWFVRTLVQEDWEDPSFLITMLWPLVVVMCGLAWLFTAAEDLAKKIK